MDPAADGELLWQSPRFRVVRRDWRDAQGHEHRREIIEHPGAVAILPWVDDAHVCLIRNRRPAVGETLLELPAGTLEPGEQPEAAARRELREETGYEAREWHPLHRFWMSPGILREQMHLFVARGLDSVGTRLEAGEDITTEIVTWQQALELVASGQIVDAKTLVGILMYERLREGSRFGELGWGGR